MCVGVGAHSMLRRPRRRVDGPDGAVDRDETRRAPHSSCRAATVRVANVPAHAVPPVVRATSTGAIRGTDGRAQAAACSVGEGFTVRGRRSRDGLTRRFGRFLARLEPPTRLDAESIKEAVREARTKTETALKDLKVPNIEELRNLIEDIRAEQSEAKYHPDRRRLANVADFFTYTEEEGALRMRVRSETTRVNNFT